MKEFSLLIQERFDIVSKKKGMEESKSSLHSVDIILVEVVQRLRTFLYP